MEQNLLAVTVSRADFEYDIHSLVKAFYPERAVKVWQETDVRRQNSAKGSPQLHIAFEEDGIRAELLSQSGEKKTQRIEISSETPRPEVKNRLKRLLYRLLSEHSARTLPWGTLTGIRPVKIPMQLLDQGKGREEILNYLEETYYVSRGKGLLSLEIAHRERALLSSLHGQEGYSLYIGIPFCPTTCLYCSFTSYPIASWKKRVGEYLGALEKEIDFVARRYGDRILDTVYIGGGTPTTLEADELDRLLGKLKKSLDFSAVMEFTVEAGRADSITAEKLEILKKWGVTRISVNPQTMKEETLRLIGRGHTVAQVEEAFHLAREAGFDNINMDLILGLPGENEADVSATMKALGALCPDSITIHSLAVKRASRLNLWLTQGINPLTDSEKGGESGHGGTGLSGGTQRVMEIASDGARSLGMSPYYLYRQKNMSGNLENVGFALEGKAGIYNILIIEDFQSIVALGAGSISKRIFGDGRIERCENVKDVAQYIERIDEMIERKRQLLRD
jgi:oxygen-independent coproporphyrinogen-3 oxidase